MSKTVLPYAETGYFSKLICDYLAEEHELESFFGRFPKLASFKAQLDEKQASFSDGMRSTLVQQLRDQYHHLATSEVTQQNIELLSKSTTFTITTGHQLNLFTGPLYFLYKIISVINLSEQLKKEYSDFDFVPIYWMATEDHDFDEINYFNYEGKKISWNRPDGGAVGEFSTEGIEAVLSEVKKHFGVSDTALSLVDLFEKGYVEHHNLADATRYIANELFKEFGLVIVDGNDAALKRAFTPFASKELTEQLSYKKVTETTERLIKAGYGEQVHPREINLFYLTEGVRERIVEEDGTFYIIETELSFTKEEILNELKEHPERFSPNALLRPLYQEVVLPNLCYVGGGGELAYWFQLKDYFKSVEIPFPIILLRNSALLVPQDHSEKIEKLEVSLPKLFMKQSELQTAYTRQLSEIQIDFSDQKEHLQQQFKDLYQLAEKTDASFKGAVAAQEQKQINGLQHLEKRLLKAQKRKLVDRLERLSTQQDYLFPKQSLQERTVNFSEFYLEHGDQLITILKEALDPLEHQFTILEI